MEVENKALETAFLVSQILIFHFHEFWRRSTLPKTNIAPESGPSQKERIVSQPHMFRGKLAVSFREGNNKQHHRLIDLFFFQKVESTNG